ncbi:MAG: hypothetical protein H0T46_35530 [Deltaproteobacteria bacterium]|nr:hypothetical protein [Deltaproteobacteria bacterium]
MTSAELIRWSTLHERRARKGGLAGHSFVIALLAGLALAAWVWSRTQISVDAYTPEEIAVANAIAFTRGSHVWLAGALVAFAVAFMRVPFHLYWRADAALLAQLPIGGGPLLDAALWRCLRAAAATTLAVAIGAAPLAQLSVELTLRHVAFAATLGLAAALFLPAVAIWAASLVAISQSERVQHLRVAAGIDKELRAPTAAQAPAPSTAALGAFPGFASTLVIVGVLMVSAWLTGGEPRVSAPIVLAIIAGVSVLSILGTRASAPKSMGTILRDVSALDRQRLAMLEIGPPTAIERAIAKLIGDAALPYSKDARLMRRRYPMAFALGGLIFLVLVIIGISQPADPMPSMTATLVGAAAYGLAVAGRLHRLPIEHVKLSATLPISSAARRRAKVVWVIGWWTIFVLVPALFAALRQPDPIEGLALLGGGTVLVLAGSLFPRR